MFDARAHKAGKWLKFELGDKPELIVVKDGQVKRGALVQQEDLDLLLAKIKRSADGRLVGVLIKGGRMVVPGGQELLRNEAGEAAHDPPQYKSLPDRHVMVPDLVAPIRAVLGADGSHNLEFAAGGQAHTLMLALSSVKHVELVTIREDIPAYRNATLHENFDPQATARL